jgi:quinol-cytochrome oxidoreductase complex cytochrome b subunit
MNNSENKTNKSKLLFGIGSSILFIALGIYLYTTKSETLDSTYSSFRKIVGIACIVFFGITGLIGLKKLTSK